MTISIASAANRRHVSYPTGRVLQGHHIDPVRPQTDGVSGRRHYRATGLPHGLHIDAGTGVITGRAQPAGASRANVTVTGTNGSASTNVAIQVTRDPAYRPLTPHPYPHFTG